MTKQYTNQERGIAFSFGDGKDRVTWLLATPVERIIAAAINVVLTCAAAYPLFKSLQDIVMDDKFRLSVSSLAGLLMDIAPNTSTGMGGMMILGVYFLAQTVLLSLTGQSLGKKAVGIRILTNNAEHAGFLHAVLLRKLVYNLVWISLIGIVLTLLNLRNNFSSLHLMWIPYVTCIGMLANEADNCRTLQDKLAGTVVVKQYPIVRQH